MCHWGAACDKVDCWRIHPPERDDFVTPPQDFCLYLDEIPMVRPDVAALPTDKEVFIDPLPFEKGTEELGQFLAAFGEVEEVPWLQGMWRPLEFIVAASWYLCDS
ncbi:unnamed protein product [Symbiodinium microadriaticum]|nr:unnamed protein product [Symbiodinium microadriaticum]